MKKTATIIETAEGYAVIEGNYKGQKLSEVDREAGYAVIGYEKETRQRVKLIAYVAEPRTAYHAAKAAGFEEVL